MKFIDKVMSIYKKELFTRKEENDSIFYFRHTDFEDLNATPYSFESVKGHKLNGYFYYYDNPRKNRLIVFDHGMGAGHYSYLREIETLAKHGYLVFSYDHTGCVDSEGENIGGFCQSLVDLNDAIASLKNIKELKDYKISVMGHSWGGYSTLNIASLHKDLASVIAISGYISVSDMIAQTFKFPMNFIRKYAYRLEQQNNPYFIEANAIDSLSSFEGKALIMHSKGDKLVDYNRHFKKLQRALHKKENIKFISLENKEHNPHYTFDAVNYKKDFYQKFKEAKKENRLNSLEEKQSFKDSFDWYKMTCQDTQIWEEIFNVLDN